MCQARKKIKAAYKMPYFIEKNPMNLEFTKERIEVRQQLAAHPKRVAAKHCIDMTKHTIYLQILTICLSQFFLGMPGAGAALHADGVCEAIFSVQLSGIQSDFTPLVCGTLLY